MFVEILLKTPAPVRIAINTNERNNPFSKKKTIHENKYEENEAPIIFWI